MRVQGRGKRGEERGEEESERGVDLVSNMLRFFSRRKIKGGRAEQKAGVRARTGPGGRVSKHALPCNIMLLDGSDLALEIGVSFFFALLLLPLFFSSCSSPVYSPTCLLT